MLTKERARIRQSLSSIKELEDQLNLVISSIDRSILDIDKQLKERI